MCKESFVYGSQTRLDAPPLVADILQDDRILAREYEQLAVEKAREYEQLAVEKASAEESLAESEDSKAAMSNEIHELVTKNDRLEQELKDASDSLEEAEDDRAAL